MKTKKAKKEKKRKKENFEKLGTKECETETILILMQSDGKPEAFYIEHELSRILDEAENEGVIEDWRSTAEKDTEQFEDSLLEEVIKKVREYHLKRAKREELILCLLKRGNKDVVKEIKRKWRLLRVTKGEKD